MDSRIFALMVIAFVASGCATGSTDNPSSNNQEQGPQTSDSATNATGQTHTVTYTSSGFQTETITVQKGDKVVWKAESGSMWVASDQHPVHSQYSGTSRSQHCGSSTDAFDQCSTGDTYRFTFTKKGEWSYHNHANPGNTGTVIVE